MYVLATPGVEIGSLFYDDMELDDKLCVGHINIPAEDMSRKDYILTLTTVAVARKTSKATVAATPQALEEKVNARLFSLLVFLFCVFFLNLLFHHHCMTFFLFFQAVFYNNICRVLNDPSDKNLLDLYAEISAFDALADAIAIDLVLNILSARPFVCTIVEYFVF